MSTAEMIRFVGPLNPEDLPLFCTSFCGSGLFCLAWFIHYEVTSNKYSRNLGKEISIALLSSVLLGIGTLLLLTWVGIYV